MSNVKEVYRGYTIRIEGTACVSCRLQVYKAIAVNPAGEEIFTTSAWKSEAGARLIAQAIIDGDVRASPNSIKEEKP